MLSLLKAYPFLYISPNRRAKTARENTIPTDAPIPPAATRETPPSSTRVTLLEAVMLATLEVVMFWLCVTKEGRGKEGKEGKKVNVSVSKMRS